MKITRILIICGLLSTAATWVVEQALPPPAPAPAPLAGPLYPPPMSVLCDLEENCLWCHEPPAGLAGHLEMPLEVTR